MMTDPWVLLTILAFAASFGLAALVWHWGRTDPPEVEYLSDPCPHCGNYTLSASPGEGLRGAAHCVVCHGRVEVKT